LKDEKKCQLCNGPIKHTFNPMKEWEIEGPLCGKCYSEKIHEHYPGDHTRVNLSDGK